MISRTRLVRTGPSPACSASTTRRSSSADFQVYKEVCSTCHALSIPFRALSDPDGPGFSEDQVKTLAATYQVTNAEPNDKGDIFKRPATPADIIPRPEAYPNDQAAAATLGKAPAGHGASRQGVEI